MATLPEVYDAKPDGVHVNLDTPVHHRPGIRLPTARKVIFTLNIGNYNPSITAMTYPLIRYYAHKIGADICEINTRKWPEWPVVYEKLQIRDIMLQCGAEWAIYIDSDTLVHPDFWDPTTHVDKRTVLHNGKDMAGNRWRYDAYFNRDGRNIGSCNWFTVASEWCLDLWHPLDITLEQALEQIFPTVGELAPNGMIEPGHLIDDFTLSRNIARYGLQFTTMIDICTKLNPQAPGNGFLWHKYNMPEAQKVAEMKQVLKGWKVNL